MAKSELVYWDSCIIIDLLEKRDSYEYIKPLFADAMAGKLFIVVSALSIAEVGKIGELGRKESANEIARFFDQPYVVVRAADVLTAKRAARVMRSAPLEAIDAIHVATGLQHSVPIFLTRDGASSKAKKRQKSILGHAAKFSSLMRILTPKDYFCEISTESRQSDIVEHLEAESAPLPEERQRPISETAPSTSLPPSA